MLRRNRSVGADAKRDTIQPSQNHDIKSGTERSRSLDGSDDRAMHVTLHTATAFPKGSSERLQSQVRCNDDVELKAAAIGRGQAYCKATVPARILGHVRPTSTSTAGSA